MFGGENLKNYCKSMVWIFSLHKTQMAKKLKANFQQFRESDDEPRYSIEHGEYLEKGFKLLQVI